MHPRGEQPIVRLAARHELPGVLEVQRQAFTRVSEMFEIPQDEMPPLTETVDDLERLADEGYRFFVAVSGGRVVGTVRGVMRPDGVVEIGRLGVDEAHLRRGLARRLMTALEDSWPRVRRFELFTGSRAVAPLGLYGSMGYRRFEREGAPDYIVWLAKERPDSR